MLFFLETNNSLLLQQHGCRRAISIITQLVENSQTSAKAVNYRLQADVICLDFSKALDRMPQEKLLLKILNTLITPHSRIVFMIGRSGRFRYVQIKGSFSPSAPISSAVPHGSALGRLLFFINIKHIFVGIAVHFELLLDICAHFYQMKNNKDHLQLDYSA